MNRGLRLGVMGLAEVGKGAQLLRTANEGLPEKWVLSQTLKVSEELNG